jgi:hypothetical protein
VNCEHRILIEKLKETRTFQTFHLQDEMRSTSDGQVSSRPSESSRAEVGGAADAMPRLYSQPIASQSHAARAFPGRQHHTVWRVLRDCLTRYSPRAIVINLTRTFTATLTGLLRTPLPGLVSSARPCASLRLRASAIGISRPRSWFAATPRTHAPARCLRQRRQFRSARMFVCP